MKKRIVSIFMIAALYLMLTHSMFCAAETKVAGEEKTDAQAVTLTENGSYAQYIKKYETVPKGRTPVDIPASAYAKIKGEGVKPGEEFLGGEDVLLWTGSDSSVTWEVEVGGDSLYGIAFTYAVTEGKNLKIELSLLIDGLPPFDGAENITLKIPWEINADFKTDSRGNHIMPSQAKKSIWLEEALTDRQGLYDTPYLFYFSEGHHTITVTAASSDFALERITLKNQPELQDYESYSDGNSAKPDAKNTQNVMIAAETPSLKSDSYIIPNYNHGSSATIPSDPTKMLLNTIGGTRWQDPGQWIEWECYIPESGFYNMALRARQNLKDGITVGRRIYIDGEVPFEELSEIDFPFSVNWYVKVLGDGEPYRIYLEEGVHIIRMEVVSGIYGEISRDIIEAVYQLNDFYRKVIMLTGTYPDIYRDYNLETAIPGFYETLDSVSAILREQLKRLTSIGKKGSETAFINDLLVQLEDFADNPDTIPKRLERFRTNISSVSGWVLDLRNMPLEVDYISLVTDNGRLKPANGNFFEELGYNIRAVLGSFFVDYSVIGDFDENGEALEVWVQLGRDQAQILKQLVDERFSPATGINVKVSLVQTGIVEATLAGKGPDVALFVPAGIPINLSSRGLLKDLTDFDTYQSVAGRFKPTALVTYRYKNGNYGLPITQNFLMMFYRKDIFSELGISPPDTWEDLYKILPVIQGKNLNFGMPNSLNTGMPDIFATLLLQKGGSYYNEDLSGTGFDSMEAVDAFYQWTEFYTMRGMPLVFDFFNRFRTGEIPIGIAPYTLYNQLYAAAPEIMNMWDFVPLPGTETNGGISRIAAGNGGEAAIMLKDVKNEENAWDFIDWFLSDDIQTAYGVNIESMLGAMARYATANVEAFRQLPWSAKEREQLLAQWDNVREIEQIPAGYYVGRNLTNAFRRVVYYSENPRYTLHLYNTQINAEIERKRIEMERFGD